jgi:hypothetical protein
MPGPHDLSPLQGDPRRQASASMGGAFLQVWHTVLAWIALKDNEVLYLEHAEDFDVIGGQGATATQIKASPGKISLGSKDAQKRHRLFFLGDSDCCAERSLPLKNHLSLNYQIFDMETPRPVTSGPAEFPRSSQGELSLLPFLYGNPWFP